MPKEGVTAMTREEKSAYMKAWRKENAERLASYNREYKAAHHDRDAEKNAARTRMWIAENKARHDAGQRKRYAADPETVIHRAAKSKAPRRAVDEDGFKAKQAAYMRNRRRTDLKVALHDRMSNAIFYALRREKAGRSWKTLVDYTLDELVARLNATMPAGYTWDDFLSGELHIDHEIPRAVFNYTSPEDHDFKRCWALSNLQLLPALDNIRKGARLTEPFQPSLI